MQKPKRIVNLSLIKELKDSPCVISGMRGVDVHHLISRKSGIGHDESWNLIPLLRQYHSEVHNIGKVEMAKKYDRFREWLIKHEWEFINGKWKHDLARER